jgi:hypothetical protein
MFAAKGYEDQLASFLNRIKEGQPPEVTVLDGVRSTIGCLRMLESARQLAPLAFNLDKVLV